MSKQNVKRRSVLPAIARVFLFVFVVTTKLNSRPFITRDRQFANYINGIIVVSLLDMAIINVLYVSVCWIIGIQYVVSTLSVLSLYCILITMNWWLLIFRRAGIQYVHEYERETPRTKRRLIIVVIVILAVSIAGVFAPAPDITSVAHRYP